MRLMPQATKKPDYVFLIAVFLLSIFGIVMISSSSIVNSFENFGGNYHFVSRQIISLVVGLIALVVTYSVDYRVWKKNALWLFLISIIMLVLVFVPGIGNEAGGAKRWIGFGSVVFQPTELLKLTMIIYLAAWLENKGENVKHLLKGFVPFVILIALVGILIMKQPDLGTFLIVMGTAAIMFFVSGASMTHLVMGGISALAVIGIMIKSSGYRMQRLLVFLNPTADSQGASYHINQALLAIGTGGLWGLGFGQSKQKYLYLPMAHTDSIFAIICEELGFIRSSIVILVFLFLAYRGFQIAKNAPDNFSRFLAVGISFWIFWQAFVNIASMLSIVPMTGVPLPFISYGGSSLIFLLAAVGIMLNISKASVERQ